MLQRTFPCTEQELYTVARIGWNSCRQHQPAFIAFKLRYTIEFIEDKLKEIDDAEALKDSQGRDAETEILVARLKEQNLKCLANWQSLKRYITDAIPENELKAQLEAAGQAYYERAARENWESGNSLLVSGSRFINDNLDTLTANLNMPPAFQATFDDDKTKFAALVLSVGDSKESSRQGTETKTKASNQVHANVMAMFLDGQQIFKNDEAIKKQFIFEEVLALVSGPGAAGLRGTITDAVTGLPIVGALFAITGEKRSATTDEEGKYSLTGVASGTYKIIITAQGYQPTEIPAQEIKVGTISTLNATLSPL